MTTTRYSLLGFAAVALLLSACSSSGNSGGGAGGVSASGGATHPASTGGTTSGGSGGSSSSGGKTGTGGAGSGGASTGTGGASSVASGGSGAGGDAAGGSAGRTGTGGVDAAAGSAGRDAGAAAGGSGGGGTSVDAGGSAPTRSAGCGKTPALKNSPSTTTFTPNNITIDGKPREYFIRWPDDYDNNHPYRLIIGLHGAMGQGSDTAKPSNVLGAYFGLWDLAKGSTIFIAPSAYNKLWDAASDTKFVDEILKAVNADLCIDTTRIMLQGFSQGAAMAWTLACSRPGVFRVAVGHSGGGVPNPSSCQPIAYMGSLGLQEGGGQTSQTDQFARWNGCTIETFARAPSGGHACYDYKGCSAGHPVRWCPYDGGHTPAPTEKGQQMTWMSAEVWSFVSQF